MLNYNFLFQVCPSFAMSTVLSSCVSPCKQVAPLEQLAVAMARQLSILR